MHILPSNIAYAAGRAGGQRALARQLGCSPVAVWTWIAGRRTPREGTLARMAEMLGVHVLDMRYGDVRTVIESRLRTVAQYRAEDGHLCLAAGSDVTVCTCGQPVVREISAGLDAADYGARCLKA